MAVTPQPPGWANRFLEWYCRPDILEETQGDLLELYERSADHSPRLARLQFVWNVIRFFRPRNIRKRKHHMSSATLSPAMLKSYVTSTIRNIRRNQFQSSINIIGLSLALGCGITIFLLLDSYYNRDKFHAKGDRLYLVMNDMKSGGIVEHWTRSPYLIGPALQEAHSAVESVVRVQRHSFSMRRGNTVFNEQVWFTDPEFFDAFSYKVIHGQENALHDPTSIAITKEVAQKYFGREDVVNEDIQIKYSNDDKVTYKIGAVVNTIPDQSSMHFGVLIPMKQWEQHVEPSKVIQWRTWAAATFVVLKEGRFPNELNTVVEALKKTQHEANDKFQIESVTFIPMEEVAERSFDIKFALSWSNMPAAMIGLGIIASFLVLLACINYMNVAVASVSTRLKEIGIRKVVGGGRRQIIWQFMIENVVFCAIATLAGTIISAFILLPGFNTLFPIHIPFAFSSPATMITFFVGVILMVAIISGAYPALYVSSFNAVTIMRGREKFGSKSMLSKFMLTLQFVISFSIIVASFVFINSSKHFESKDWGYQHNGHLYTPVSNLAQFREVERKLASNKHVIAYAGAESHIGMTNHITTINIGEDQVAVNRFEVGFRYLETMDVKIVRGRSFDENIASDKKESVIINEAFARKMNWSDPLGKTFDFDGQKWYIIGVAKDFNFQEFYTAVEPVFIHIGTEERYKYLAAHVEAGHLNEVSDELRSAWNKLAPDDPYEGKFQDDVFQQFFNSNSGNNKIMMTISIVALALAIMGLYGLMSYNLTRRLKEFSIRKVFGASMLHILKEMNRDYAWIVITAFVIAAPLGWQMVSQMIKAAYPEEIPIPAWPFVLTGSLMISTVVVTVATQLGRLNAATPAETLKND
ncbi:FtsX-like permease family protein [Chryseolinea sp. T2]|uniref:FtsX-like permease family protein n=1 Tax=Chryseolinea sp. T2 TaxID=3129255 RepID=UPI003076F87A